MPPAIMERNLLKIPYQGVVWHADTHGSLWCVRQYPFYSVYTWLLTTENMSSASWRTSTPFWASMTARLALRSGSITAWMTFDAWTHIASNVFQADAKELGCSGDPMSGKSAICCWKSVMTALEHMMITWHCIEVWSYTAQVIEMIAVKQPRASGMALQRRLVKEAPLKPAALLGPLSPRSFYGKANANWYGGEGNLVDRLATVNWLDTVMYQIGTDTWLSSYWDKI